MKSSLYRTELGDTASVYPEAKQDLPLLGPDKTLEALQEQDLDSSNLLLAYISLQHWRRKNHDFAPALTVLRLQCHRAAEQSIELWIDLLFLLYLGRHADRQALDLYLGLFRAGILSAKEIQILIVRASGIRYGALRDGLLSFWARLKVFLWIRLFRRRRTARSSEERTGPPRKGSERGFGDQTLPADTKSHTPRLAFVVPRFGSGFSGGIEIHAMEAARLLAPNYAIRVYTTCATDYLTWNNEYPPGEEILTDPPIQILRFPSATRNLGRFVEAESRLKKALGLEPPAASGDGQRADGGSIDALSSDWLRAQGPLSEGLQHSLLEDVRAGRIDTVIFFTLQYSLTANLLFEVKKAGIPVGIIPAAHPDWTLEIPILQQCLAATDLWITSTPEEEALLRDTLARAVPPLPAPPCLPGGVPMGLPAEHGQDQLQPAETTTPLHKHRQKESAKDSEPPSREFLLYVGRLDPSKGVDELLEFFLLHRLVSESPLDLILVGNPAMAIPEHPGIRLTGFLSDKELDNLYRRATALVNPSPYESLSLVLLEAWARKLPTLSNGNSKVLEAQTVRSGCGLCYRNAQEFLAGIEALRNHRMMAVQGPKFVRDNYNRDCIADNYREAVDYLLSRRG